MKWRPVSRSGFPSVIERRPGVLLTSSPVGIIREYPVNDHPHKVCVLNLGPYSLHVGHCYSQTACKRSTCTAPTDGEISFCSTASAAYAWQRKTSVLDRLCLRQSVCGCSPVQHSASWLLGRPLSLQLMNQSCGRCSWGRYLRCPSSAEPSFSLSAKVWHLLFSAFLLWNFLAGFAITSNCAISVSLILDQDFQQLWSIKERIKVTKVTNVTARPLVICRSCPSLRRSLFQVICQSSSKQMMLKICIWRICCWIVFLCQCTGQSSRCSQIGIRTACKTSHQIVRVWRQCTGSNWVGLYTPSGSRRRWYHDLEYKLSESWPAVPGTLPRFSSA